MSIFSRFHKRNLSLSSGGLSPFFVADGGRVIASQTINASDALTNSDIFAVVSRIASNVAMTTYKTENPLINKAIKQPSQYINGYSFWQKVVVQLLLTGNAYVLINRDGNNIPRSFIQVPASNVQINLLSKDAGDPVNDIVYTITLDSENGKTFTVRSSDVLHFRCLVSGFDEQTRGFCGISPLVSLAQEVSIQNNSNRLANASLNHAIAPSYVIKLPQNQIKDALKENWRNQVEKMTSGANTGRALVMDTSMDLQPLQVNPNIDSLLSNTRFSQSQIAKAFGIPDEYLNGQGDQQSSIQMMNSLYVNGLAPYVSSLTSEMSAKFGVDVRADFTNLADVDHSQLISQISSLTSSKSPVIPSRLAVRILRNNDALGLADISDDDIDSDFKASEQAGTSSMAASPPTNNNKEGDQDEEQTD